MQPFSLPGKCAKQTVTYLLEIWNKIQIMSETFFFTCFNTSLLSTKSKNKQTILSLDIMVKKKVNEWYNSILKIIFPKNHVGKNPKSLS